MCLSYRAWGEHRLLPPHQQQSVGDVHPTPDCCMCMFMIYSVMNGTGQTQPAMMFL
jgi:hypothetical protein